MSDAGAQACCWDGLENGVVSSIGLGWVGLEKGLMGVGGWY